MEPLKPDYSGPNVMNVVPAVLGLRPVEWLPEPVAGARAVVLLVLDGLGWEARTRHAALLPELSALDGRAITTVIPSTTPAALTSITTGLPPGRHGITGFRIRVDHSVLNAIRWQQENGKRPPEPADMQRHAPFADRQVAVVTKSEFRRSGFTGVHLRGADFHGWPTTAVLVEHVRALVAGGEPFVYAYYPGVDEVAHAFGIEGRFYAAELAAADRLVGAVRDVLPEDTALLVTADHGQVNLGQESWIGLGALDSMIDAVRGRRALPLSPRARRRREGPPRRSRRSGGRSRVGLLARPAVRRGLARPGSRRAARRRVGDVVLAARDAVGFVDPTFPGRPACGRPTAPSPPPRSRSPAGRPRPGDYSLARG